MADDSKIDVFSPDVQEAVAAKRAADRQEAQDQLAQMDAVAKGYQGDKEAIQQVQDEKTQQGYDYAKEAMKQFGQPAAVIPRTEANNPAQQMFQTATPPDQLPVATAAPPINNQAGFVPALQAAGTPQQVVPVASAEDQFLKATKGNIGVEEGANKAIGDAAFNKFQQEKTLNDNLAAQADKDVLAHQDQQKERQHMVSDQEGEMRKISDEYQKSLGQKINPNQFWESRGTGEKVLGAIAIALGAMGGALTGKGGNVALDIFNRAIDQDIDAQKENIRNFQAGKLHQYDMSQNLMAQMYKKFGNEDQAEAATRLLRMQQAQYQLNSMASGYNSVDVQQRVKILNSALEQKKAELQYQFSSIADQKALAKQVLQNTATPGKIEKLQPQEVQLYDKVIPGFAKRYVPDYRDAINEDAAKEFREKGYKLANANEAIQDALKYAKSGSRLSPEQRAILDTKLDLLTGDFKEALGLNRLTDFDIGFIKDTRGDPNAFTKLKSAQLAKLNESAKFIQNKYKGMVDSTFGKGYYNMRFPSSNTYKPAN